MEERTRDNDAGTHPLAAGGVGGRWAVAQMGARMHYAVPRALHAAGHLDRLYTDAVATRGWPSLLRHVPEGVLPAGARRLAGRRPTGVPTARTTAFTALGVAFARRYRRATTAGARLDVHRWAGETFGRLVVRHGLGAAAGAFGYNTAALEVLVDARRLGLATAVEQASAPAGIERALHSREHERFPEWEDPPPSPAASRRMAEREQAEWAHADVVLCGSEFVARGVAAEGGPQCHVVPYGYGGPVAPRAIREGGPLRVLVAGRVSLLKGSPYVFEAARLLGSQVTVRMLGEVRVSGRALADRPASVGVLGHVSRADMAAHYEWADVFLLPSLCEGSATAVYEALASGLPVVCTPHTGSIVRDGVEGAVVPVRDAEAIAGALLHLCDPAVRAVASARATARAMFGSEQAYAGRLLHALVT